MSRSKVVGLRLLLLSTIFCLSASVPFLGSAAQGQPPQPRFERPVRPGAAGSNRLDPDLALLAGAAPTLADLRLYDDGGREVPYLLVPPARRLPEWLAGRLLPVAATKTTSGFEFDLGAIARIDRLRLEGIPAPFLKRYRLEGGGDRSRWTELVGRGTLFDLPDQELSGTEAAFAAGDYRYLRITWDDRDSAVAGLPSSASARRVRTADAPAPLEVPVEWVRRASEPGVSRFHLRLPGAALPVVALRLEAGGGNLLRRVTVTQGRFGNGEVVAVPVGSGTLRRAQRGALAAADLRIQLGELLGPELDLRVEDGDNPPLGLTGVKAELAPLPWIYFEAPAAGTLMARYGDPRQTPGARPPRYDLEAVREDLGKIQPAAARWGEAANRELAPVPGAVGKAELPTTGAALDVSAFRFHRPVPAPAAAKKGGAPVLTSLLLDAAVLSRSPGLSDLRLADGAGRQIPYLVDRRSERLALDLPGLAAEKGEGGEPGVTRYAVTLPEPNLPEARLVLSTSARVFERQVRLVRLTPAEGSGRRRGRGRMGEATVAEATWRHADPETAPPQLVLDVPESGAGKLELRIDEGDNEPLALLPPRLLLPAIRIRFFYPAVPSEAVGSKKEEGGLRLLYGQPNLGRPRYDLALLAPRLLGSAAEEVELAPEKGGGGRDATAAFPRWAFWGVLGLAVIFLLALLARLLR